MGVNKRFADIDVIVNAGKLRDHPDLLILNDGRLGKPVNHLNDTRKIPDREDLGFGKIYEYESREQWFAIETLTVRRIGTGIV